jgi:hypothetical protein
MRRLLKFARASWAEKALFLFALVVVVGVRLGLTLLSYKRLQTIVPRACGGEAPMAYAKTIAVAVSRAARLIPKATCLTQAVSAQYMLACRGYISTIRIGVAQDGATISAHAWLLSGSTVVLGGGETSLLQYRIITDLALPVR